MIPLPNAVGLGFAVTQRLLRPGWKLTLVDPAVPGSTGAAQGGKANAAPKPLAVESQYPQEDIRFSVSCDTSETAGFGARRKAVMTGPNAVRSITFQTTIQSRDAIDDIRPIRDLLWRFASRDTTLGRLPLLRFENGDQSIECYLTQLEMTQVGGLHITGIPKRYEFQITLKEATDRPLEVVKRKGQEPSTWYHVVGGGETPESVALLYVQDPALGPLIELDPDNRDLGWVEGDRVKILPRENVAMRAALVPTAPFAATDLRTGEDWDTWFDAFCGGMP